MPGFLSGSGIAKNEVHSLIQGVDSLVETPILEGHTLGRYHKTYKHVTPTQ